MKANNEEIYGAIELRRRESPEILLLGRFLESNRCHMNYLRLETSITAIMLKIRDIWYLYLRIYLYKLAVIREIDISGLPNSPYYDECEKHVNL